MELSISPNSHIALYILNCSISFIWLCLSSFLVNWVNSCVHIQEGRVEEEVVLRIVKQCTQILRLEDNLIHVEAPITSMIIIGREARGGEEYAKKKKKKKTRTQLYSLKFVLNSLFFHLSVSFLALMYFFSSLWRYSWPILRSYEAFWGTRTFLYIYIIETQGVSFMVPSFAPLLLARLVVIPRTHAIFSWATTSIVVTFP